MKDLLTGLLTIHNILSIFAHDRALKRLVLLILWGFWLQDVPKSKSAGRGAKVVTAKITASLDSKRSGGSAIAGQTLAPPMPSIVVERHQPITKVNIYKFFMCKY